MYKVTATAVILTAMTACSQNSGVPSSQWSFEVPSGDEANANAKLVKDGSAQAKTRNAGAEGKASGDREQMGPAFTQPTVESATSARGDAAGKTATSSGTASASLRTDPVAQLRAYLQNNGQNNGQTIGQNGSQSFAQDTSSPSALANRAPSAPTAYLPAVSTASQPYDPAVPLVDEAFLANAGFDLAAPVANAPASMPPAVLSAAAPGSFISESYSTNTLTAPNPSSNQPVTAPATVPAFDEGDLEAVAPASDATLPAASEAVTEEGLPQLGNTIGQRASEPVASEDSSLVSREIPTEEIYSLEAAISEPESFESENYAVLPAQASAAIATPVESQADSIGTTILRNLQGPAKIPAASESLEASDSLEMSEASEASDTFAVSDEMQPSGMATVSDVTLPEGALPEATLPESAELGEVTAATDGLETALVSDDVFTTEAQADTEQLGAIEPLEDTSVLAPLAETLPNQPLSTQSPSASLGGRVIAANPTAQSPTLARLTRTMPNRDLSPLVAGHREANGLAQPAQSEFLPEAIAPDITPEIITDTTPDIGPEASSPEVADELFSSADLLENAIAAGPMDAGESDISLHSQLLEGLQESASPLASVYVPIAPTPEDTSEAMVQEALDALSAESLGEETATEDLIAQIEASQLFSTVLTSGALRHAEPTSALAADVLAADAQSPAESLFVAWEITPQSLSEKYTKRSPKVSASAIPQANRRQRLVWL
jgi:hypothetical protein